MGETEHTMAKPTTAQLTALLADWRDGAIPAADLAARTDAILAALQTSSRATAAPPTDLAALSDAELIAHYKRTSYLIDVDSFLAHRAPRANAAQQPAILALQALRRVLQTRAGRPADRTAYLWAVQQYWAADAGRWETHSRETCPTCGDRKLLGMPCQACRDAADAAALAAA